MVTRRRNIRQELGLFFAKDWKIDIKNTLILIGLLFAISFTVSVIAFVGGVSDLHAVEETIVKISESSVGLLQYLVVVRVVSEEIFFRGFLVKRIGIFGSALVFGLAHAAYGSAIEIVGAFLLGLALAWAFSRNRNLVPNIFAHMIYNLVILMLIL